MARQSLHSSTKWQWTAAPPFESKERERLRGVLRAADRSLAIISAKVLRSAAFTNWVHVRELRQLELKCAARVQNAEENRDRTLQEKDAECKRLRLEWRLSLGEMRRLQDELLLQAKQEHAQLLEERREAECKYARSMGETRSRLNQRDEIWGQCFREVEHRRAEAISARASLFAMAMVSSRQRMLLFMVLIAWWRRCQQERVEQEWTMRLLHVEEDRDMRLSLAACECESNRQASAWRVAQLEKDLELQVKRARDEAALLEQEWSMKLKHAEAGWALRLRLAEKEHAR